MNDPILFRLVHDFLQTYLPAQRRASPHTIRAYRTSLELLLDYTKLKNRCGLADVRFDMIDAKTIADFLDHIENERGCSISTRNHRLRCIMAFLKYAASIEPTAVTYRTDAQKVPLKKTVKAMAPDFMNESAVKAILEQPDAKTPKGMRDRFLMILLYDTGARIHEILSTKISDFRLGATPTVNVIGKGLKPRTVPLMAQTTEHLAAYLKVLHADEPPYSNAPLFYVVRKGVKTTMSVANAEKLIKSYGEAACNVCADVPDSIHPHLFRHSRAMHLYQRGMDLTLIAQWLGHADLNTVLVYAYADTEKKRIAIAKAMEEGGHIFDSGSAARFEENDDDILKKLYGLR
jgi:site-specific recombinase XerD